MRVVRVAVAALALLALSAGCGGDDGDYTVPSSGPHEPYVDRVLDALGEAHRATLELLVDSRAVTPEVEERVAATFTPEEARARLDGFANVLAQDLEGFAGPEQTPSRTVARLLDVTDDCIVAEVTLAFPGRGGPDPRPDPPEGSGVVVELRRAPADPDRNPTGWAIAREELVTDAEQAAGCR